MSFLKAATAAMLLTGSMAKVLPIISSLTNLDSSPFNVGSNADSSNPSTFYAAGGASLSCPTNDGAEYLTKDGGKYSVQCSTEHVGADISVSAAVSMDACLDLCDANYACVGVSWFVGSPSGECHLKGSLGARQSSTICFGAVQVSPCKSKGGSTTTTDVVPYCENSESSCSVPSEPSCAKDCLVDAMVNICIFGDTPECRCANSALLRLHAEACVKLLPSPSVCLDVDLDLFFTNLDNSCSCYEESPASIPCAAGIGATASPPSPNLSAIAGAGANNVGVVDNGGVPAGANGGASAGPSLDAGTTGGASAVVVGPSLDAGQNDGDSAGITGLSAGFNGNGAASDGFEAPSAGIDINAGAGFGFGTGELPTTITALGAVPTGSCASGSGCELSSGVKECLIEVSVSVLGCGIFDLECQCNQRKLLTVDVCIEFLTVEVDISLFGSKFNDYCTCVHSSPQTPCANLAASAAPTIDGGAGLPNIPVVGGSMPSLPVVGGDVPSLPVGSLPSIPIMGGVQPDTITGLSPAATGAMCANTPSCNISHQFETCLIHIAVNLFGCDENNYACACGSITHFDPVSLDFCADIPSIELNMKTFVQEVGKVCDCKNAPASTPCAAGPTGGIGGGIPASGINNDLPIGSLPTGIPTAGLPTDNIPTDLPIVSLPEGISGAGSPTGEIPTGYVPTGMPFAELPTLRVPVSPSGSVTVSSPESSASLCYNSAPVQCSAPPSCYHSCFVDVDINIGGCAVGDVACRCNNKPSLLDINVCLLGCGSIVHITAELFSTQVDDYCNCVTQQPYVVPCSAISTGMASDTGIPTITALPSDTIPVISPPATMSPSMSIALWASMSQSITGSMPGSESASDSASMPAGSGSASGPISTPAASVSVSMPAVSGSASGSMSTASAASGSASMPAASASGSVSGSMSTPAVSGSASTTAASGSASGSMSTPAASGSASMPAASVSASMPAGSGSGSGSMSTPAASGSASMPAASGSDSASMPAGSGSVSMPASGGASATGSMPAGSGSASGSVSMPAAGSASATGSMPAGSGSASGSVSMPASESASMPASSLSASGSEGMPAAPESSSATGSMSAASVSASGSVSMPVSSVSTTGSGSVSAGVSASSVSPAGGFMASSSAFITGTATMVGSVSAPAASTTDITTTIITTSYVDVCPTGYTTKTITYTTTYCPASQTPGANAPGFITTTTLCQSGCGPAPTVVTLTKPMESVPTESTPAAMTSVAAAASAPANSMNAPGAPATSAPVFTLMSTSTMYSTVIVTQTACPPSVENCPARHMTTGVVTSIIAISTTVCPVTVTSSASASSVPAIGPAASAPTQSVTVPAESKPMAAPSAPAYIPPTESAPFFSPEAAVPVPENSGSANAASAASAPAVSSNAMAQTTQVTVIGGTMTQYVTASSEVIKVSTMVIMPSPVPMSSAAAASGTQPASPIGSAPASIGSGSSPAVGPSMGNPYAASMGTGKNGTSAAPSYAMGSPSSANSMPSASVKPYMPSGNGAGKLSVGMTGVVIVVATFLLL